MLQIHERRRGYALDGANQARNQGEKPLQNFSPPLEICVGNSLKLLDIIYKIWAPLRKLFATPGVPSSGFF